MVHLEEVYFEPGYEHAKTLKLITILTENGLMSYWQYIAKDITMKRIHAMLNNVSNVVLNNKTKSSHKRSSI